jgi:hypothetical protein
MITVYPNFEAPGSFHGLYIKDVVNISDTNTATEKYSRIGRAYKYVLFRIYNIG